MAETDLPEDVIVNILSWLPVKSLIRFTSVSKRFRSIILSDPKFARSQFKAACQRKTLGRRVLFSTDAPQLESLDLDTPSFGELSSVRKLSFPFQPQPGGFVKLLGSSNGLVFVAFDDINFYIWNPSIGFFKELPVPGFSADHKQLIYYGAGYLSATDDYKVFAASFDRNERTEEMEIFSLTAHVWKTIPPPGHNSPFFIHQGTLFNEALHWLHSHPAEILAFDLAQEEFRTMRLPYDGVNFHYVGVSEGCLCVCSHLRNAYCSVDFWVMREYGVSDSWTTLFNFSYSPEDIYGGLLVMESSTVAIKRSDDETLLLVKIDHKEKRELGMYMIEGTWLKLGRILYEESLLWIND